jgi:hypothetical protein
MSKIADRPRGTDSIQIISSPSGNEIRRELDAVLASPSFHGSKRCQQFLEYVCEKSLSGKAADLKERTVAVDVFGRAPQSDLSDDTIVRVGAREVRKRLAQYYVTEGGAASAVRIDLMPGSYAPEFRYVRLASESLVALPVPQPVQEKRRGRWIFAACGLVALLVIAVVSLSRLIAVDPATRLFTMFWQPFYRGSEPTLLAVGNPIVYHPSARAAKLSEGRLPRQKIPFQRALQLEPEDLNGADMIPVVNQYVGFGDMIAATEISSMLARKNKGTRVRLSANVAFADMRQSQVVLIGAFTNRWTMELGQNWKLQFGRTPDNKSMIFDATEKGAAAALTLPSQWSIPAQADGSTTQDYILICRIRNSSTGGFVVVAAGLKQFGTDAAGRLLSDPAQLGAILSKLPAGWESKNLQLVLHSTVIGNAPAQPEMVASQIW